jgi:hypothetical protein
MHLIVLVCFFPEIFLVFSTSQPDFSSLTVTGIPQRPANEFCTLDLVYAEVTTFTLCLAQAGRVAFIHCRNSSTVTSWFLCFVNYYVSVSSWITVMFKQNWLVLMKRVRNVMTFQNLFVLSIICLKRSRRGVCAGIRMERTLVQFFMLPRNTERCRCFEIVYHFIRSFCSKE